MYCPSAPYCHFMKEKPILLVAVTTALLGLVGFFLLAGLKFELPWTHPKPSTASSSTGSSRSGGDGPQEEQETPAVAGSSDSTLSKWLMEAIRQLAEFEAKMKGRDAIPNEAIFTFKDKAAYDKFLKEAEAAGLRIIDKNADMLAVRLGYDDPASLRKYIASHPNNGASIDPNYTVTPPPVPADRSASTDVPFGGSALGFIGVKDNSTWGQGVKIAVLDSPVSGEAVFGNRLSGQNLVKDITTDLGHGTAVASIAGGTNGVAPASTLLSLGVVAADGFSDSFTLAQGIRTAVDQGAKVLNVSLGSYGDSEVLSQSVIYSNEHGAVIVASAGNDAYNNPTYPARYEGVVAVSALDAYGQVVSFSNSATPYGLSAPGLEVQATNVGGDQIAFSGTSAATPFVAGAIASVMSLNPGMTPRDAVGLLQTYANDAGAPGADADFGYGIVNVSRVNNRNTPNISDAAVASHYFNANDPNGVSMNYVVQNQGTTAMVNYQLNTNTGGDTQNWTLPIIQPNQESVVRVPLNNYDLTASVNFQSHLTPPQGVVDSNRSNNGRASTVQTK
jgi:thermitase